MRPTPSFSLQPAALYSCRGSNPLERTGFWVSGSSRDGRSEGGARNFAARSMRGRSCRSSASSPHVFHATCRKQKLRFRSLQSWASDELHGEVVGTWTLHRPVLGDWRAWRACLAERLRLLGHEMRVRRLRSQPYEKREVLGQRRTKRLEQTQGRV